MIDLRIEDLAGTTKFLTGATLGKKHSEQLIQSCVTESHNDQTILILNFDGIEFVSASYFKAFLLALAQTKVNQRSEMALFPIAFNLSKEMSEELSVACEAESFPSLEVTKLNQNGLVEGKLYGEIDNTFKRSLQLLQSNTPATAADLAEQSPDDQVNITAWNNRLAELFRLRLATRLKEGRFWKYQPVIKEIVYG